jgi:hypothetical protein
MFECPTDVARSQDAKISDDFSAAINRMEQLRTSPVINVGTIAILSLSHP